MSDGKPAPAHPDAVISGDTWRFTVLSERLIRLEWDAEGRFVDERTQLVVNREFEVPEFTVTEVGDGDGDGVEITTSHLRLRYSGGPFSGSSLSVTLVRGGTDPHYTTWRFGDSYPQHLPLRGNLFGTARTLDEVDGACPLEPGILATYGFATLDDSTSVILTPDGWVAPRPSLGASEPARDLYLFGHGRDYAAALADYHHLTGPTPLVPRFVLGNWWSRYWPYSDTEYLALMDTFAEHRLPFSVAVIDMDWHLVDIDPEIGTGWTGYTWNPDLFPHPERFLGELHRRGLAATLNVHPADGVRRHEERYPEMARALGMDPADGVRVEFDVTDRAFVDAYLTHLHHPREAEGVDFWWLDWQSGGTTRIPGLDPLWMLNHIHYTDAARAGRRPLTFSRYAGPGSHRYPVGFSGDTITTWESLDFQPYFTATAANIGYPWWSHDIGGHMFGDRDVEMAVRWFQLGAFSPINRLHSANSPFATKEPWSYGPAAAAVMGAFLRLRHKMVPFWYTAAWAAHTDHTALVRPVYHEHPMVRDAYLVPNQALIGEHLLLAPITAPGDPRTHVASVAAWLPPGAWVDLFTGLRYDGGRRLVLHRPLGQYPVFARAGAVLPLQADALADIAANPDALELRVIPGDGRSTLAEDDVTGVPTLADRRQTVFTQRLVVDADGAAELVLTAEAPTGPAYGAPRSVVVDVAGVASVAAAELRVGGSVVELPRAAQGSPHGDELLAPALRCELGHVDLDAGFELTLRGARPIARDTTADAHALLAAAEIAFVAKEQAWQAVKNHTGLALAEELATIDLPDDLRGALVEIASGGAVW
ncbi:glycoside hydrolase family 31 protein [Propioniciclava soli]|uniref:glycoside hydrolase family 31 protein n=1 Tax=Propioniciclava soli TaxID=2775081 RepID=UPI001E290C26|nr:glycoside hydrolase family 31 protein [Propioniciclava soli]